VGRSGSTYTKARLCGAADKFPAAPYAAPISSSSTIVIKTWVTSWKADHAARDPCSAYRVGPWRAALPDRGTKLPNLSLNLHLALGTRLKFLGF
jgi:hypothetical protein